MPPATTLFAIFAVTHSEPLEAKIKELYPELAYEVYPGQWLLVAPSTTTTVELSNQLGITDGSVSGAIVVSVSSYYGRAGVGIWEWITAKTGAAPNVSQAR